MVRCGTDTSPGAHEVEEEAPRADNGAGADADATPHAVRWAPRDPVAPELQRDTAPCESAAGLTNIAALLR